MKYEIDQSGKIEQTKKLTIVAYANGKAKTLLINSKEKRKLLKVMRTLDYPKKTYIYKIFAGLVFLLIKNENIKTLIIDREYPGQEGTIKGILLNLIDNAGIKRPNIQFSLVTKKSPAHKAAIETFRGKRKADLIVKAIEVLRLFYD